MDVKSAKINISVINARLIRFIFIILAKKYALLEILIVLNVILRIILALLANQKNQFNLMDFAECFARFKIATDASVFLNVQNVKKDFI